MTFDRTRRLSLEYEHPDDLPVGPPERRAGDHAEVVDGFRPDRWDLIGAAVCLIGVLVIFFGPRGAPA